MLTRKYYKQFTSIVKQSITLEDFVDFPNQFTADFEELVFPSSSKKEF